LQGHDFKPALSEAEVYRKDRKVSGASEHFQRLCTVWVPHLGRVFVFAAGMGRHDASITGTVKML
jgi:hypothetical protein